MKRILLIFPALFFISLNAQIPEIQRGQEFDNPGKRWTGRFLDPGLDMFYALRTNRTYYIKDLVITGFRSNDASLVFETPVKFEQNEYYLGIYHKNAKILVFTGYDLEDAKKSAVVLREYDDTNGKELSEAKVINQRDRNEEPGKTDIEFSFSPDGTKMLIMFTRFVDDNLVGIKARIYNTGNFSMIGERNVAPAYQNSPITFQKYLVSNDGSFIYSFSYENERNKKSGAVAVQAGVTQPAVIKLPDEDITLTNNELSLSGNKLLIAAEAVPGINRDRNSMTIDSVGFGLITIDLHSLKIQSSTFDLLKGAEKARLDYKVKNPYYGRVGMNSRNKPFIPYKMIAANDGVYCIWLNRYALVVNNGGTETIFNYSREILVLKYNSDFKLQWTRVVPRYMLSGLSESKYYVNYAFADKLRFFYLENPDNLEDFPDINAEGAEAYKFVKPDWTSAVPVMVTISNDGTMSRIALGEKNVFSFGSDYDQAFLPEKKKIIILPDDVPKKKDRVDLLKF